MTTNSLDVPGYDTWLARTLLERGLLDLDTLQGLLAQARTGRPQGLTLANLVLGRSLLARAQIEALLAEVTGTQQPPPRFCGVSLGDHEVIREIGAGGMGVVYLAVHTATGAKRAIKTLTPRDPEAILRFRREGEALARVGKHRNVVSIHDLGQAEGRLYLVMDYAAGGSLADRLKPGPLPPPAVAKLVAELARGLAHVHGHGILHRDLKPANVLFDEVDTPKLVDFGLAKLAWEGSLTASGTVMGTPAYMAPEQIKDSTATDERSDVYGLGAVLYESLTGRPPFSGKTVLSTLTAVLEGNLAPPSKVAPDVPPWLDSVCLKALARDPARRQPTALALAEELAAGNPLRGGSPSLHRAGVLAALSAVALLAGVAFVGGQEPRSLATPQAREPDSTPTDSGPKPRATGSWPVPSPLLEFASAEDLALGRQTTREDWPRRLPLAERLAAAGKPSALREFGLTLLQGRELRPGVRVKEDPWLGFILLARALKHGNLEAGGDLALLFLDESPDLPPVVNALGFRDRGRALKFPERPDLAAALLKLAGDAQRKDTSAALSRKLLEVLAGRGITPPTDRASCFVRAREAFEPESEHWPGALPTWPVTFLLQFSEEDRQGNAAQDESRPLPERLQILEELSRRGHASAQRSLALHHLSREEADLNPGKGLHLLWQALRGDSKRAAVELAILYAPPEYRLPLGLHAFRGGAEALALQPELRITVAGLKVICERGTEKNRNMYRGMLQRATSMLGHGAPEPTLAQAYAYLEEFWEPPEVVLAERRALASLDARIAEWRKADPLVDAYAKSMAGLSSHQLLTAGKNHVRADMNGEAGSLQRMVISWRLAWREGHTESQARLSSLLIKGRRPQLEPAPLPVVLRWLFRLAEAGERRAALVLMELCAYPEASGGALQQDLLAASAWLRLMESPGVFGDRFPGEWAKLRARYPELPEPPPTTEAWRVARQRWPPKLR